MWLVGVSKTFVNRIYTHVIFLQNSTKSSAQSTNNTIKIKNVIIFAFFQQGAGQ
jgi:hypothetical protein